MNMPIERLARFQISPELVEAAGVRYGTDNEVRELLGVHGRIGQDLSGIVFPYRDPRDGRVISYRVRLDVSLDGQKYLSAQGCRTLFFSPIQGKELTDTATPAVIVEAEKSALALTALAARHARKLLVIAAGGVWGWKRNIGTEIQPDGTREPVTGPSPSLDLIEWKDRKVILALDSNVAGRKDLQKARLALAEELNKRGAQVFIASTPSGNGVNGPDDLIAVAGDNAALKMLDRPARFARAKPTPIPGVLASEVTPETVRWLWANHIPLGKVTLFDGDPDEGKSHVTIDLAARLTRGGTMPDGTAVGCLVAGAVIVSLEDGVADTIRPRLEATGAALERVRIVSTIKGADGIERTPTIPDDLPALETAIQNVNAKLLVLDPLVATLDSEINSYRDQDIRRALAPVAALAERTGVSVIGIRHLTKGSGQNPKYRGGGSIGIIGAARAAFLFADAPGQDRVRVMAPVKGNLWRGKPEALEYVIEEKAGQPVIAWHGKSHHSAQSLLAQPDSAEESNALTDAKNFLTDFLKDGPRSANDVKQEARRAGVSERTLYRAKATLGIMSRKSGIGDGQHWQWVLSESIREPKTANNERLAIFEQVSETKPVSPTSSPNIAKPESLAMFRADAGSLRRPADADSLEDEGEVRL